MTTQQHPDDPSDEDDLATLQIKLRRARLDLVVLELERRQQLRELPREDAVTLETLAEISEEIGAELSRHQLGRIILQALRKARLSPAAAAHRAKSQA